MPAALIDEITAERVGVTGKITVEDILALVPRRRRKTWTQRITFQTDNRWISASDPNFGTDDTVATESALTGVDPIVEWENIGEPLKQGDHLETLEIRSRANNTQVTDVEILILYIRPDPITRWDTGYDNDAEIVTQEIYRDFWVNNSAGALGHNINDRGRRILNLNFTAPEDGEFRVFFKSSGTLTAASFFYPNFMLDMIVAP